MIERSKTSLTSAIVGLAAGTCLAASTRVSGGRDAGSPGRTSISIAPRPEVLPCYPRDVVGRDREDLLELGPVRHGIAEHPHVLCENAGLAGHRLEAHDEGALPLVLGLADLEGGGTISFDALDLGIGDLNQFVQLLVGSGVQLDLERARKQEGRMRRFNLGRKLPVIHEGSKQAVLLGQPPQNGRQHVQGRLVGMIGRHGRPDQLGAGLADRIGHPNVLRHR